MESQNTEKTVSFITKMVRPFLTGPLSIIVILFATVLGIAAIFATPREEEPQIVVPMVDVFVNFPGQSPQEVEELVSRPLEKLMWQIDGVEHVYSMSRRRPKYGYGQVLCRARPRTCNGQDKRQN